MTRLWPHGEPISVESDEQGPPRCFTWRGETHPVEQIATSWRVDECWWQDRHWREYFKLITTTGLLITIYRDCVSGVWYVERLYD